MNGRWAAIAIFVELQFLTIYWAGSRRFYLMGWLVVAVEALKEIGEQLGKRNWNFSLNPCDGNSSWLTPSTVKEYNNSVTCKCSSDECHVDSMYAPLSLFLPFFFSSLLQIFCYVWGNTHRYSISWMEFNGKKEQESHD